MSDTDCGPTGTENERALQACFNRGGVTFQPDSVAWRVAQTWCYGNSYSNSVEIAVALGIDPDMPVADLKAAIDLWRNLTDLANLVDTP